MTSSSNATATAGNSNDFASLIDLRSTKINLNAGPSPLPLPCLIEASQNLLSHDATPGFGIAELSHRSAAFQAVIDAANSDLRALLVVPDNYSILWMQGGGLTQFATTVLNLLAWYRLKHQLPATEQVTAEYVVTGSWSLKAAQEAARLDCKVNTVIDGRNSDGKFTSIPSVKKWSFGEGCSSAPSSSESKPKSAFIYYCDNETVDGVEFPATGDSGSFPFDHFDPTIPIVCDMSSNFLSRPVDVARYGIIYAGAQKNLGPAGVSVVIVRNDLIVDTDLAVPFGGPRVPCMLSYKNMVDSGSMYNTPPTFAIYVCSLVLRSLLVSPPLPVLSASSAPLEPLARFAAAKSNAVYEVIDLSAGFYIGTVLSSSTTEGIASAGRSRMNVTFRLRGSGKERDALEKKFVKEAELEGIVGVSGHRSVGGIRTSLYNAVTLEQVQVVVLFMKKFQRENTVAAVE